jgi:hypothetical protein
MLKDFSTSLTVALFAAQLITHNQASAQNTDELYEHGTEIGMLYLAEHSGRLRVTLVLQECGFGELASSVGAKLPLPVQFFMEKTNASNWDPAASSSAAQVTRGYVLGYETGVRSEFRREQSDERRHMTCSIAAAAAGQIMQ